MKYSGTHLLQSGEQDLVNYNLWLTRKLLERAELTSESKVLDFGAGIGTLSQLVYALTGTRPDCVEIDPGQREVLEQRGFRAFPEIGCVPDKYDFIFSSNVLEHIENDTQALIDLKAKLAASGTLAIFVPAFEAIWSPMDDAVGHCRRYTKRSLADKLNVGGYELKEMHYCDSLGFVLSYIFRYVSNSDGEPSSLSLRMYDRLLLPVSRLMDIFFHGIFGKNVFAIAARRNQVCVYENDK